MGRMKDAITDVTFTLTKLSTKKVAITRGKYKGHSRTEDQYMYTGDNGAVLAFQAHPTRAWSWIILPETNALGRVAADLVIEAFCTAGSSAGEDFNLKIQTLNI